MLRKKKKFSFTIPKIRPIGLTGLLVEWEWASGNTYDIQGKVQGSIRINGRRNRVVLKKGAVFTGHLVIDAYESVVIIGADSDIRARIFIKGNLQTLTIGDGTSMQSGYILCQENCDITIGRACMISRNVEIRTSDAHSLIDRKTCQRLNQAADIVIGDHVWIGMGAIINKGSKIPEDSVVGALSFVNKSFEESGIVLAGVPARIIRRDVTWNRGRNNEFTEEELNAWRAIDGRATTPDEEEPPA